MPWLDHVCLQSPLPGDTCTMVAALAPPASREMVSPSPTSRGMKISSMISCKRGERLPLSRIDTPESIYIPGMQRVDKKEVTHRGALPLHQRRKRVMYVSLETVVSETLVMIRLVLTGNTN